ncbi:MAG: bifunctional nuclease family protein [Armatimonadetes bacterium]|nr:bifunctional nuclease family protein [Armatimonadota bacterium]
MSEGEGPFEWKFDDLDPFEVGPRPEEGGRWDEARLNPQRVEVQGVYEMAYSDAKQHFVLLNDGAGRNLPIFIGIAEAMAISIVMSNGHAGITRPLSHDLMNSLIQKLGGAVLRVVVDDLYSSTYYAKLIIETDTRGTLIVDSRPSDAIALALHAKAPIYVADDVFERSNSTDLPNL